MFTISDIQTYVLTALGSGSTDVELNTTDINTAIKQALSLLDSRVPMLGVGQVSNLSSINGRHVLNHKGIIEVVDVVVLSENFYNFSTMYLGEPIPLLDGGTTLAEIPIGTLLQIVQRNKQLAQMLSQNVVWEAGWEYNAATGKQEYVLHIDVPSSAVAAYKCSYRYTIERTVTNSKQTGVGTIVNPIHKNWIKEYTLALCQISLGRVRNKFHGMPSPMNMDMQLNGRELVNDGMAAKEKLDAQLLRMQPQIPLTGG